MKIGQAVYVYTQFCIKIGVVVNIEPNMKIMTEDGTFLAEDLYDPYLSFAVESLVAKLRQADKSEWIKILCNDSIGWKEEIKKKTLDIVVFVNSKVSEYPRRDGGHGVLA